MKLSALPAELIDAVGGLPGAALSRLSR